MSRASGTTPNRWCRPSSRSPRLQPLHRLPALADRRRRYGTGGRSPLTNAACGAPHSRSLRKMTDRPLVVPSLAITIVVLILLLPDLAHAQAGAGQAQSLLQWVVTTIGRPMLNAGILLVAFFLLCARVSLGIVRLVAPGGLVVANYQQISGFFGF